MDKLVLKGKPIDQKLLAQVEGVWKYQFSGMPVHELTCGSDDCREVLCVGLQEDNVFLFCKNCGYVQDWIPEVIFRFADNAK